MGRQQETMEENGAVSRAAPRELVVEHPAWREALGEVRAALSRLHPVVAVLGPAGTGKTLLLRALLGELRAAGRDAVLLERGDADSRLTRPGTVLVDEADRIGPAALEALAGPAVRGVVLAALPAFAPRLEAVPGATVVSFRLLRPEEAAAFLRARAEATRPAGWLTDDAIAEIVANGGGIPRVLGALLTAADFVATVQAAPHVTAEHVQEAVLLRGAVEADEGEEVPPVSDLPPAEPDVAGNAARGPDPGERWAESASLAGPVEPAPVRRHAGRWAMVACAAGAALIAAYATPQASKERAVRWLAAFFPDRAAPAPTVNTERAAATEPAAMPGVVPAAEAVPSRAAVVAPAASAPAPDPAPAPSGAGLSRGVVPHVVLSYRQGDAEAERRALDAVRTLRTAGFSASDPVPVVEGSIEPGVTYFFAEDQAGAADVVRALGSGFGEARAAPLRPDEPLPRPGTIELLLASEQPETAERAR